MPCNQVVLNKVEIRVASLDLLVEALTNLDISALRTLPSLLAKRIIADGFVWLPAGQEYLADRIKQEYSRQAILAAARKSNWRLQENPRQKRKLTATRRA